MVHGYTAQVDTGTVLYEAPTDNMASNAAFNEEEQQPSTMHRPSGSGFGAEENYEEQSNMERRENVRSSGSRGSSGARGRQTKAGADQARY